MAPPTTAPRLRDLDPTVVARQVAQQVLDHIVSLSMQLVSVHHIPQLPEPEQTEIYRVVRVLAGYARGDHALDASVHEYLISLIPLWQAPLGEVDVDLLAEEVDPRTDLGLVIRAALARERLAEGKTLRTGDLAALGGMAQPAVALLLRQGEIRGERGEDGWAVRANEARRWLQTRPTESARRETPGARLSALLSERSMTKSACAEQLGVTYQAVMRWTRNTGFNSTNRKRVAEALGLPESYFDEGGPSALRLVR